MPYNDFISELLECEDMIVNKMDSSDTEQHIYFSLKRRDCVCPNCNAITNKVHDYRTSIIKDVPLMGKHTFLHYKKRRYHCICCNKHFTENFSLLPKQHRITTRLSFYSIHLLKDRQSVSSVSNLIGISPSSIFRRMNDINFPTPNTLPEVLSIDEFKGNANGQKFQAILTDAKHKTLFDILPTRSQTDLMLYLQQFTNKKNVKYFVTDMNRVYKDLARDYFPNAKIVIDKFHVVRYVTWALENVRKRIQKELHPDKRKYFKRSRRLLLTHKEKLKGESIDALELMLLHSEDLAKAYYLKELFFAFMQSKSKTEAVKKLKIFILAAECSHLKEFNATLTMLRNWSSYILNAFDCPYTNGYTEGTNNAIKVIKRNAFGYRNFKNFRNRIMLSLK